MLFAEHLHEGVLLKHPHRHDIFSLAKRLRVYFRFGRFRLPLLYRAAWDTWNEYALEQLPAATTGAVMVLHTAGHRLHFISTPPGRGDPFCARDAEECEELLETAVDDYFLFAEEVTAKGLELQVRESCRPEFARMIFTALEKAFLTVLWPSRG